jgi:protein-S-isoprenylcysteine O-methyltransferase Ste14
MVTIVVPSLIVNRAGGSVPATLPAVTRIVLVAAGAALVAVGLLLMIMTITLFAKVGHGTLAPWDPTKKLVVRGAYRYVRNPMISGVLFVLLGEAALLASLPLFLWFATFFTLNAVYIPLREEPGLAKRFGEDYRRYKRNVPRWIPRLTAWTGDSP